MTNVPQHDSIRDMNLIVNASSLNALGSGIFPTHQITHYFVFDSPDENSESSEHINRNQVILGF
jgi:hypothetical protein